MTTVIDGELREYKASSNFSKPSVGFIDLATYGSMEQAMYSEKNAITYFMRETVKCSWFSQIPVQLQPDEDNVDFGQTFSVKVSREGDYLMNTWLRVTLAAVSLYYAIDGEWNDPKGDGCETLSWTPNFMHNLVEHCQLKVNGTIIDEFYSEHLDFWSAFMVPKGSRIGYNRMIGNFSNPYFGMTGMNVCGIHAGGWGNLNFAHELFLPLPFFYSKNTGLSLPMASLPYNEVIIEFKLRNWRELAASIAKDGSIVSINASQTNGTFTEPDGEIVKAATIPRLDNVQVWGNYAMVTQNERKKIGCITRDMVIEQNQQLGGCHGSGFLKVDNLSDTTHVNLRLSGAVKSLFFAARNSSGSSSLPYRSNYTTSSPSASDISICGINVSGCNVSAVLENSNTRSTATCLVNNGGGYAPGEAGPISVDNGDPLAFAFIGNSLYNSAGASIGVITAFDATSITFGAGTSVALADDAGIYYDPISNAPPYEFDVNNSNNNINNFAGLMWYKQPTDPIGTAKILYENDVRMNMESLYYSLIQPYFHAKNIPDSSAMKSIMSISDPSQVSGESALSIGYHMYSYALKLSNIDPCGSTNYNELSNASIVFTPSTSAVNCYPMGYGPWRLFVSAVTQNVLRINNGAMEFPVI